MTWRNEWDWGEGNAERWNDRESWQAPDEESGWCIFRAYAIPDMDPLEWPPEPWLNRGTDGDGWWTLRWFVVEGAVKQARRPVLRARPPRRNLDSPLFDNDDLHPR